MRHHSRPKFAHCRDKERGGTVWHPWKLGVLRVNTLSYDIRRQESKLPIKCWLLSPLKGQTSSEGIYPKKKLMSMCEKFKIIKSEYMVGKI